MAMTPLLSIKLLSFLADSARDAGLPAGRWRELVIEDLVDSQGRVRCTVADEKKQGQRTYCLYGDRWVAKGWPDQKRKDTLFIKYIAARLGRSVPVALIPGPWGLLPNNRTPAHPASSVAEVLDGHLPQDADWNGHSRVSIRPQRLPLFLSQTSSELDVICRLSVRMTDEDTPERIRINAVNVVLAGAGDHLDDPDRETLESVTELQDPSGQESLGVVAGRCLRLVGRGWLSEGKHGPLTFLLAWNIVDATSPELSKLIWERASPPSAVSTSGQPIYSGPVRPPSSPEPKPPRELEPPAPVPAAPTEVEPSPDPPPPLPVVPPTAGPVLPSQRVEELIMGVFASGDAGGNGFRLPGPPLILARNMEDQGFRAVGIDFAVEAFNLRSAPSALRELEQALRRAIAEPGVLDHLEASLLAPGPVGEDEVLRHSRRLVQHLRSDGAPGLAAIRRALQLSDAAATTRMLTRVFMAMLSTQSLDLEDSGRWAPARDGAGATDAFVRLATLAGQLKARIEPLTDFCRRALQLPFDPDELLLGVGDTLGSWVRSITFVGGLRTKSPFRPREPFAIGVPAVDLWRDQAIPTQEGERRVRLLGDFVFDLRRLLSTAARRHVYNSVVDDLDNPSISFGELLALHLHRALPTLSIEVWEVQKGSVRLLLSRLAGGVSAAGEPARELTVPSLVPGRPRIEGTQSGEVWLEAHRVPAQAPAARLLRSCQESSVCTVLYPLPGASGIGQVLRIGLPGVEEHQYELREAVRREFEFPARLGVQHGRRVAVERRGARRDTTATVSHHLKNRLSAARSDLDDLRYLVDDENPQIGDGLLNLKVFLDVVARQMKLLDLASQERVREADLGQMRSTEMEGWLRSRLQEMWRTFHKDRDYLEQHERFRQHVGLRPPEFHVDVDLAKEVELVWHMEAVGCAVEEVLLNALRHACPAEPDGPITLRARVGLSPDAARCELLIENPGSLPVLQEAGAGSGGRRGGRASVRQILEDILGGVMEMRNGDPGMVLTRLVVLTDHRRLFGGGQ